MYSFGKAKRYPTSRSQFLTCGLLGLVIFVDITERYTFNLNCRMDFFHAFSKDGILFIIHLYIMYVFFPLQT